MPCHLQIHKQCGPHSAICHAPSAKDLLRHTNRLALSGLFFFLPPRAPTPDSPATERDAMAFIVAMCFTPCDFVSAPCENAIAILFVCISSPFFMIGETSSPAMTQRFSPVVLEKMVGTGQLCGMCRCEIPPIRIISYVAVWQRGPQSKASPPWRSFLVTCPTISHFPAIASHQMLLRSCRLPRRGILLGVCLTFSPFIPLQLGLHGRFLRTRKFSVGSRWIPVVIDSFHAGSMSPPCGKPLL